MEWKYRFINGNILKLLALVTMTIDHVGLILMGNFTPFRIVGRLAFPIFAYMIAEGCRYTKNKVKYLCSIFAVGLLNQIVLYITLKSLMQSIMITFTLSILMVYAIQWSQSVKWKLSWLLPLAVITAVAFICEAVPFFWSEIRFSIDYGFWGATLPVFISLSNHFTRKWFLTALGLLIICLSLGGLQWWSFMALIPLLFYNGQRGKWNIKWLFYIYYPLHLAFLWGISFIILM